MQMLRVLLICDVAVGALHADVACVVDMCYCCRCFACRCSVCC